MKNRIGSLAAVLAALVLLATAAPATAFNFCFSFGSKSNDRPRYGGYLPPYTGVAAPRYPAYGYSPLLPAYDHDNIYYPLPSPYVTVPPGDADR